MAALGQASGLSAREVALRTEMDKVQVSRAVARLMRGKRVQKQTDTSDGRVTRLSAERAGTRHLQRDCAARARARGTIPRPRSRPANARRWTG